MKNPKAQCGRCLELVFGIPSKYKKPVICQQCRIAKNAGRKYQRLTSKCNWRSGAPMLPALDRPLRKKAAPPPEAKTKGKP